MKEKLKKAYMRTAHTFAECSHAVRLKVGAIIVKDNKIISIGYNGMPAGWDNCCEDKKYMQDITPFPVGDVANEFALQDNKGRYKLVTRPEVLHAETNSITKLARGHESGEGSAMFCTHAPCIECAKLIHQAGITSLYYANTYRSLDGINFLQKASITTNHYPTKE